VIDFDDAAGTQETPFLKAVRKEKALPPAVASRRGVNKRLKMTGTWPT